MSQPKDPTDAATLGTPTCEGRGALRTNGSHAHGISSDTLVPNVRNVGNVTKALRELDHVLLVLMGSEDQSQK